MVTLLASMPRQMGAGRPAPRLAASQRSRVAGHAAGPAGCRHCRCGSSSTTPCATSRMPPTSLTPARGRPSATRGRTRSEVRGESNMSSLPDPIRAGIERGWKVLGGSQGALPESVACDVAIVGTGAGGRHHGRTADRRGVVGGVDRGGPPAQQPRLQPDRGRSLPRAVPGQRQPTTADKAISILQGRCVGGSTTVNWTSSFRTPVGHPEILARALRSAQPHRRCDVALVSAGRAAAPHRAWLEPPNANNERLRRGAARLGICAARSSQCEGLRESRLLRPRLPDRRQAEDAGDDHSRGPGPWSRSSGAGARRANRDGRPRPCAAIASMPAAVNGSSPEHG